jgi:hypothetical protein
LFFRSTECRTLSLAFTSFIVISAEIEISLKIDDCVQYICSETLLKGLRRLSWYIWACALFMPYGSLHTFHGWKIFVTWPSVFFKGCPIKVQLNIGLSPILQFS